MKQNDITSLIRLIDDPDEEIYNHIKDKLLSFGNDVIPALENYWEDNSYGTLFQNRIEDIIHLIQFEGVKVGLAHWAKHNSDDLLEGVLFINRYQFPDLDVETVRTNIKNITRDVWLELNENLTAFEKINVVNHILFGVHGFKGNKADYHSPQNSYLSNVLEGRKGNPLSLSILYLVICRELEIPVFGINLPNHFILSYIDDSLPSFMIDDEELSMQFYINPFSKGAILHKKEIDEFLHQLKLEQEQRYYEPCSNVEMIQRMLNNLIQAYSRLGAASRVDELGELYDVLKSD